MAAAKGQRKEGQPGHGGGGMMPRQPWAEIRGHWREILEGFSYMRSLREEFFSFSIFHKAQGEAPLGFHLQAAGAQPLPPLTAHTLTLGSFHPAR